SFWFVDLLVSLAPADVPRLGDVRVSAAVLCFTAGVTFLTAFLFGLFPALAASRINLNESLKEGSGKLAGARSGRSLRRALIVAEISLTLCLLVGAGLLLRTFQNLREVKLGYDPDHVLTAQLRLSGARYDDPRERKDFYKQLLERVSARGEVAAASAILIRPLEGAIGWEMDYAAEHQSPEDAKRNATANYEVITPDYFRTMNIPLLAGRDFKESDRADVPHVVIISETLAKRLFAPGIDPIGRRIKLSWTDTDSPWRTIIGVAGDARYRELQDIRLDIYVPYRQSRVSPAYLTIRTRTNPEDFIPALRREVAAIDPDQALTGIVTMNGLVANSLARPKFIALLLSLLAGFTAVLAAVGIYGVISFMVTERTHEIGVRVALGAQRGDVLRLVIGQGLWLVVLGIAIGLPATLLGARLIASLLYGVGAADPVTFGAISLALLAVAVAASYIPARRATKVDPLTALRYE
ncbi:MAG TPA: FtsX-like permease family protein, partial [Pyrinomonadaceae bacterium]|nr:FtsX-like permease family protein [Pyrinomonadaceae bacterium]